LGQESRRIGTITVNSATSLTVQLTAASNATPQPYSILAITRSEHDVLPSPHISHWVAGSGKRAER
jgi:hypothetical protein